jgi:methionine-S-sulfoxide reductase
MKSLRSLLRAALLGTALLASFGRTVQAADPAPKTETAVLAAGCYWCMEAIFEQQPGVLNVVSGFAGGEKPNPTYEEVCTETTGYAESIKITFDPAKTSFDKLLSLYWRTFDPTNGNGVAPDFGSSYRPIIFYLTPAQKSTAEASKAAEAKKLGATVATKIQPFTKFWPGPDYHQHYVTNHPDDPYVRSVTFERMDRVGAKHP